MTMTSYYKNENTIRSNNGDNTIRSNNGDNYKNLPYSDTHLVIKVATAIVQILQCVLVAIAIPWAKQLQFNGWHYEYFWV